MQFISKRIFWTCWWPDTYLFFLLISFRLSVSWLYNLPLCLSTYFAVDVLSELSMVVAFIIMPSWRVNICLYYQLQNTVGSSLVVSLFQKISCWNKLYSLLDDQMLRSGFSGELPAILLWHKQTNAWNNRRINGQMII